MRYLLQGLAAALGGGLQGYANWKMYDNENRRQDAEQRRQDIAMAEEVQNRRAQAEANRMRALADMAAEGIAEGTKPTGKMEFGGTGLGAHFIPKISIDNDQRYREVAPGFYQDFTQSRAGREISARQARAKEQSDERFAGLQEKQQKQASDAALLRRKTDLYRRYRAGDKSAGDELLALGEVQELNALTPRTPAPRGEVNWQNVVEGGLMWQVDPRSGKMRPVLKPDGTQAKAEGKGDRQTVAEQKAESLLTVGQNAFERIAPRGEDGKRQWAQQPTKGAWATRLMLPESMEGAGLKALGFNEDMELEQNAGQVLDAWIRHVSGAAVPEKELVRYIKLYAPSAMDPDNVKANKLSAMESMISALQGAAGGGYTLEQAKAELESGARRFQVGPQAGSAQRTGRVNPIPRDQ